MMNSDVHALGCFLFGAVVCGDRGGWYCFLWIGPGLGLGCFGFIFRQNYLMEQQKKKKTYYYYGNYANSERKHCLQDIFQQLLTLQLLLFVRNVHPVCSIMTSVLHCRRISSLQLTHKLDRHTL